MIGDVAGGNINFWQKIISGPWFRKTGCALQMMNAAMAFNHLVWGETSLLKLAIDVTGINKRTMLFVLRPFF